MPVTLVPLVPRAAEKSMVVPSAAAGSPTISSATASSQACVWTRAFCHYSVKFAVHTVILRINKNEEGIMAEGPRLSWPFSGVWRSKVTAAQLPPSSRPAV